MRTLGVCVLVLVVFWISPSVKADFFPIPSPQFSGEDVTTKTFGTNFSLIYDVFPIAYGDFNADKLTDIIAVSNDGSSVVLFIAHEEAPFFRIGRRCDIRTQGDKEKIQVIGAAPGDFTGDGVMDLLVTMRHEHVKSLEIIIFEGSSSDLICENRMVTPIDLAMEPLLADLNGDMVMDLVGEEYVDNDFDHSETQRAIWIFSSEAKLHPTKIPFIIEPNIPEEWEVEEDEVKKWNRRRMIDPPSISFVDVNQDLFPDIVMIVQDPEPSSSYSAIYSHNFQVHIHSPTNISFRYLTKPILLNRDPKSKNPTATIPMAVVGQSIFVDFNRTGFLSQLVPYCAKERCEGGSLTSPSQGIKVIQVHQDASFQLGELYISNTSPDGIEWAFPRTYAAPPQRQFMPMQEYYSRSIVLRVGDYNLDGFPDLIAVLEAKGVPSGSGGFMRRAVLFQNDPCKEPSCPYPRVFNPNYKLLEQYSNVSLATFFDIHEDALIDVLIVKKVNASRWEVRAFQNSPDYDSNFLKVMVLTGLKCPKCPQQGIPYGNVIPGPVISYQTKTQAGDTHTATAAQNYRSTGMPMDLPYTIFGIGHSPNFVENLKVSVCLRQEHDSTTPSGKCTQTQDWPQIIPNSQIIIIPHPIDDHRLWKAKLFLTPSDAVLQTFGVLMAICLVVFGIVVFLQVKEVREDRRDRRHEAHRFMM